MVCFATLFLPLVRTMLTGGDVRRNFYQDIEKEINTTNTIMYEDLSGMEIYPSFLPNQR